MAPRGRTGTQRRALFFVCLLHFKRKGTQMHRARIKAAVIAKPRRTLTATEFELGSNRCLTFVHNACSVKERPAPLPMSGVVVF